MVLEAPARARHRAQADLAHNLNAKKAVVRERLAEIYGKPLFEEGRATQCELEYKTYDMSMPSFRSLPGRLWYRCGETMTENYVKRWLESTMQDDDALIFTAEDQYGRIRAFIGGSINDDERGLGRFIIDVACSKDSSARPNTRHCPNAMIHLFRYAEAQLRLRGFSEVHLTSVPEVVGYYVRLGYRRTVSPCAAHESLADKKARNEFNKKYPWVARNVSTLGKKALQKAYENDPEHVARLQSKIFKNLNVMSDQETVYQLSKCIM